MNTIAVTKCRELPKERVEAAISTLSGSVRRRAARWYHSTVSYRDKKTGRTEHGRRGSESFAAKYPDIAVTPKQDAFMWELHNHYGLSFREVEAIMKLRANQGNDAQRCINRHLAAQAEAGKANQPKYFSPQKTLQVVQSYLRKVLPPKRADIAFRKIIDIIPNHRRKPEGSTRLRATAV